MTDRPHPDSDPYLSPANLESIADSLQIVASLPDEEAAIALAEMRSIWRRDALGMASTTLKQRDRAAYDRIRSLVVGEGAATIAR
jgi:hypothetical protein